MPSYLLNPSLNEFSPAEKISDENASNRVSTSRFLSIPLCDQFNLDQFGFRSVMHKNQINILESQWNERSNKRDDTDQIFTCYTPEGEHIASPGFWHWSDVGRIYVAINYRPERMGPEFREVFVNCSLSGQTRRLYGEPAVNLGPTTGEQFRRICDRLDSYLKSLGINGVRIHDFQVCRAEGNHNFVTGPQAARLMLEALKYHQLQRAKKFTAYPENKEVNEKLTGYSQSNGSWCLNAYLKILQLLSHKSPSYSEAGKWLQSELSGQEILRLELILRGGRMCRQELNVDTVQDLIERWDELPSLFSDKFEEMTNGLQRLVKSAYTAGDEPRHLEDQILKITKSKTNQQKHKICPLELRRAWKKDGKNGVKNLCQANGIPAGTCGDWIKKLNLASFKDAVAITPQLLPATSELVSRLTKIPFTQSINGDDDEIDDDSFRSLPTDSHEGHQLPAFPPSSPVQAQQNTTPDKEVCDYGAANRESPRSGRAGIRRGQDKPQERQLTRPRHQVRKADRVIKALIYTFCWRRRHRHPKGSRLAWARPPNGHLR